MTNLLKDYSFVRIGAPAVPRGLEEVVYIIDIDGDKILTTNGTYTREQLSSTVRIYECYLFLMEHKN